jgi:hypothetical protein
MSLLKFILSLVSLSYIGVATVHVPAVESAWRAYVASVFMSCL